MNKLDNQDKLFILDKIQHHTTINIVFNHKFQKKTQNYQTTQMLNETPLS